MNISSCLCISTLWLGLAFTFDAAGVKVESRCASHLDGLLDLPGGWGFVPGELNQVAETFPNLREHLISDARMARFISDERNQEFFDLLGAYANAGMAKEALAGVDLSELPDHLHGRLHRQLLVHYAVERAIDRGLAPVDFDKRQKDLLAEALGPLPFAEPIRMGDEYSRSFGEPRSYLAFLERGAPGVRALVLHSKLAQFGLLSFSPWKNEVDVDTTPEAFRRFLKGDRDGETPAEALTFDYVNEIMKGNYPEIKQHGLQKEKGARRQATLKSLEHHYVSNFLAGLMDRVREITLQVYETSDQRAMLHSPLNQMEVFDRLLHDDLFIDQGLTSFLRRAFVEMILKKTVVRGPVLVSEVKGLLRKRLGEVRNAHRSFLRGERQLVEEAERRLRLRDASSVAASPTPVLPNRGERIRDHESRLKETSARSTPTDQIALPGTLMPKRRPDSRLEDSFWERLADAGKSMAEAREAFERDVRPETTYVLPLIRTGFQYKIQFSPKLIKQLLNPQSGEPEDLRAWVEALRQGPARAENQNGWIKLKSPAFGRYRWEIKLRTSVYRILGNQNEDGVWIFEVVQLMH